MFRVRGANCVAAGTCADYSVCAIICRVKKRTVLTKQAQEFAETMDIVWVLSGFEKKTEKTPPAEIRKALKIKKELGL